MKATNLLQSFGMSKDGRVVSVRDVERGNACDCYCPVCGELLVARQGDIRVWHFAHQSGTDCDGAGEGALHFAAKQIIAEQGDILVPALQARCRHQMADGRVGEAALVLPAQTWTLTDVRTETVVGDLRVDVSAVHDGAPVFIEVAVTHCVDDAKQRLLSALGIPCFEIALDALAEEEWTWDSLAAAVLHDPGNRNWLFHPELARLEADARQRAIEKALANQIRQSQEPDRIKLRLFGTAISVIDRGWGLCLWSRYDDKVNPIIKSVAQSFGGRWNPKYKNWVVPSGAKAALLAMLEEIGAERLLNGNGQ